MMDEEMLPQLQTVMNYPGDFCNIFFGVGQKKACPPIEKGGGCPGTASANPVRS